MKLPGRLSIACIEEDNPLKSYFRIKPLVVTEQDRIELFREAKETFPTEGYMRVVPDKNEMSVFKARMHDMGRYCLLDLRKYPGENEKIRINKNYDNNGQDTNAFIVYSDVILSPAQGLLTQVIDVDEEPGSELSLSEVLPVTPFVALRFQGKCFGPYKWTQDENGTVLFSCADALKALWPEANRPAGICISLEDGVNVFINISSLEAQETALPAETAGEEKKNETIPEPIIQEKTETETGKEEQQEDLELPSEYPYTSHRAINARITMREQALLAQMGISPKRCRSLYQIVDEKWRKSRIDQLGHPVPLSAMGSPAADDPIENAMTSIRAVLAMPEARTSLIEEMRRNEVLNEALETVYGTRRAKTGDDEQATALEAEKLRLSGEIEALKSRREAERRMIMEELRTQYAAEFSRLEAKKKSLDKDIEKLRNTVDEARSAASVAVKEMNEVTGEEMDKKLREHIISSRVNDLLKGINGEMKVMPARPATVSPSAAELISDVRSYFERAGNFMDNDTTVNLLACLTLSRGILLSGPVGSGKRDLVRLLAGSIGVLNPEYRRFMLTSDENAVRRAVEEGNLVSDDDTISIAALINPNGNPNALQIASSLLYNMQNVGSGLRIIVSIADAPDALPVSSAIYDRAFMIRLGNRGADAPWRPAAARPLVFGQAVSLKTLKDIFAPVNDLPAEMEMRMTALREQLDKLGTPITRRSLDATWNYCSAVLPYMQCSPLDILDYALSQRGLPTLLACMPPESLMKLPDVFKDMKRCMKIIDAPIPLPALY